MRRKYITIEVQETVSVDATVSVSEVINQIDSEDLISELKSRGDYYETDNTFKSDVNGHTRELIRTLNEILKRHSNHLELNKELELKYLS